MKNLYIECKMGAAGDMLMASLLELLPDKQVFIDKMNSLGIPGVTVESETSVKCGITGTHMVVKVNGMEEHEYFHALKHAHGISHEHHEDDHQHMHDHGHDHAHTHDRNHDHMHTHDHDHDHPHTHDHGHDHAHTHDHDHDHPHTHDHGHDHHHTGMHEIGHIIADLDISEKVRADITSVYSLIAEAESHSHGIPVSQVHFHEVGAMDAIADITGVCLLIEMLSPDRILVSPVNTGSGYTRCTHGTLPVPAPATAFILRGIPIYSGASKGELCTPTGAALLKHFADEFCQMPLMTVSAIGYGMGMKDFEQANCVRAMLFTDHQPSSDDTGNAIELDCNLDDMTPEAIAYAAEKLLTSGAMDVWTEAIGMKKGRPGTKLCCLCSPELKENMLELIFRHTSTIGIREYPCSRYTMQRRIESRNTAYGPVQAKVSSGYGTEKEKIEYDDLSRLADENGISISDILKTIK